jgi:hypothetical protein
LLNTSLLIHTMPSHTSTIPAGHDDRINGTMVKFEDKEARAEIHRLSIQNSPIALQWREFLAGRQLDTHAPHHIEYRGSTICIVNTEFGQQRHLPLSITWNESSKFRSDADSWRDALSALCKIERLERCAHALTASNLAAAHNDDYAIGPAGSTRHPVRLQRVGRSTTRIWELNHDLLTAAHDAAKLANDDRWAYSAFAEHCAREEHDHAMEIWQDRVWKDTLRDVVRTARRRLRKIKRQQRAEAAEARRQEQEERDCKREAAEQAERDALLARTPLERELARLLKQGDHVSANAIYNPHYARPPVALSGLNYKTVEGEWVAHKDGRLTPDGRFEGQTCAIGLSEDNSALLSSCPRQSS